MRPDDTSRGGKWNMLMESVVERNNMINALKRVRKNKGAPGVDGMTVDDLTVYLNDNWERIREELLEGAYIPSPVRRVEIPKPDGGVRMLGIPTVLDRLIQQALLQVMEPIFDPEFSNYSMGFRKYRKAQTAVQVARHHVNSGRSWVVDLDLEKFFDRVNHDILMARVARKVTDKRVLKLVRRFLESGIMADGVVMAREEGTPQGGPLSPLLANIILDDLDKELERRGHSFIRYADDCNIYVKSRRAGERVMASVKKFLEEKLSLRVNEAKSKVDRPWKCKFLGFSMYPVKDGVRIRIAPKSIQRVKARLRQLTNRNRSENMANRIKKVNEYLRGWIAYYSLADAKKILQQLRGWIHRRLRACLWKQWKRVRTRIRELRALGHPDWKVLWWANDRRGPWAIAGTILNNALPTTYWKDQGLVDPVEFYETHRQAQ